MLLQIRSAASKLQSLIVLVVAVTGLLQAGSISGFPKDRPKAETISATARGTGTQMGRVINISLEIYEYSPPEDRQFLIEAYQKKQGQGLVNALSKMKAVGHISITGTLGYDVSYVRMIPTPTGRKIRFVTNRPLTFGEAMYSPPSSAYNLTAGELDLNDQDKKKSTGVLYPAAQFDIDKEGQLQIQLNQNPWKLNDIIDWKGKPGTN